MGCLFGLGRMIASGCFGLGAFLASIFIRGLSFLFLTVIGPLCLGSVRELVIRIMRASNGGRSAQSRWWIGNRAAYAVLSGLVWAAACLLLRLVWQFLGWIGAQVISGLSPSLSAWLPPTLLLLLVFSVGTIIGASVHRHENGGMTGW